MTYTTTKAIRDLQDNEFCYHAGAIYPRPELVVSQERLDELVEKGAIVKIEEPIVDEIELEEETIVKIEEPIVDEIELEEETIVDEVESDEELTVNEIKTALDELGIKYSSRANKAELLELLKGA